MELSTLTLGSQSHGVDRGVKTKLMKGRGRWEAQKSCLTLCVKLSFGDVQENNVPGIYDGPFPWEDIFGFHLAGMVGHDFF